MNTIIGKDIDRVARILQEGGLVGIPTETVYGLAANALDADAVVRIFETKGRPSFNPLIVHVHDVAQFEKYVTDIPELVYVLADKFCPGPLTFILPRKSVIPDIVVNGGETVAIRIPDHPMTLELLSTSGLALAAPSANPFGYISPVTAMHVMDQLHGKLPYILDGGPCKVGLESTVVSVENNQVVVHRLGGVSTEQLLEVAGNLRLDLNLSGNPQSPGKLKSHYAPAIPLMLGNLEELLETFSHQQVSVLSFNRIFTGGNIVTNEVLSRTGDLHEAARNLFGALRRLDQSGSGVILAEMLPEIGLGMAINDRLRRAASRD